MPNTPVHIPPPIPGATETTWGLEHPVLWSVLAVMLGLAPIIAHALWG